jgi:iron complex transport system substrate-binding protein
MITLSSLLISGCIDDDTGETVRITDMIGRSVDVPKTVDTVIGVEAGALRLLVYMKHTDKVVGVEENEKSPGAGGNAKPYIFANPGLLELPTIGPMHGGDAELIVAQQPDIIFYTEAEAATADDLQTKTGIPVVVLNYGDLNENRQVLFDALDLIGDIMGNPERAVEVRSFIEERIQTLDNMTSDLPEPPTCYVGGIGYRGAHGMLSTEPSYSSLEFVNGVNVASSLGLDHAFVDKEKVIEWNPEIILVDEGGLSNSLDDLGDGTYDTIDAMKDGSIHGILPYNWYTTNYGTVLGNSYYIAKVLHPGTFQNMDPVDEINDIYEFLVGGRVYEDMAREFGGFQELDV